jgi:hypothetical protein
MHASKRGRPADPTIEEWAALVRYAASHGHRWKAALRADWENGRCQSELQQLRNRFGPSWLISVDIRAMRTTVVASDVAERRRRGLSSAPMRIAKARAE